MESQPPKPDDKAEFEEWYATRARASQRLTHTGKKSNKSSMRPWILILVSLSVIIVGYLMVKTLTSMRMKQLLQTGATVVPERSPTTGDTLQITPKVLLEAKQKADSAR